MAFARWKGKHHHQEKVPENTVARNQSTAETGLGFDRHYPSFHPKSEA